MIETDRILGNQEQDDDLYALPKIRPQFMAEYIGQTAVREQLSMFIDAAKMRREHLHHVLLYGPPGLGKTT